MTNGKIIIGDICVNIENDEALLSADIKEGKITKKLYYSVNARWRDYLVTERSDAFVVALLYYAMIKNLDIEWEIPCSKQLIYQLKTYFIPIYETEILSMHRISLSGPVTDKSLATKGGVATGLSNGVDSLYTVKKYLKGNFEYSNYSLTHVLFTDCFTSDFSEEYKADFLKSYLSVLPECTKELGLEFIFIRFPIDSLFSIGHVKDEKAGILSDVGLFTLKYCSMAMALNKLIKVYYFSGGFSASDFTFNEDDMAYHDIFTLPLISNNSIMFYSTGMEVSRIEKVKYIADWQYAQNHLQVCQWRNDTNCGNCSKCRRTMSELKALGKLEEYSKRFPVENYNKNFSKRMARVLVEANRGHIFEINIIKKMKENGIHIPIMSYIYRPFYQLLEAIRLKLRFVKWARKIYRKYNLDKLLYGTSTRYYVQSVDREILGNVEDSGK